MENKRILLLLLITVKIGSGTSQPFRSTIGTPQGDGLSPVLFICYLEAALFLQSIPYVECLLCSLERK